MTYVLEMQGLSKSFPGVKALDDINIKIKESEIHSLCGENGAGKSTLIKILSGIHPFGSYEGELLVDGHKKKFDDISDAEDNGIVCIHQELALIPELTIQDNIFLGNEPNRFGIIKQKDTYRRTQEILNELDLNLDPNEKIRNLGVGHQQLVEIAKALSKNTKILILDEPTSALTEKESEILLSIIKKLKAQGVTSIYISHKLDEVFSISDSVSVLRDGKFISSKSIEKVSKDDIIYMMVGRKLEKQYPYKERKPNESAFEVKNYSVYDPKNPDQKIVKNISFKANKGEILGVSGLMGAGRTEMFSSIFGVYPGKKEGEVYIEGKKKKMESPTDAIKQGIALVSEDRKSSGLVLGMTVGENISMASLTDISKITIDKNKEKNNAIEYIENLNIKTPSVNSIVNNLSGGNQQKVVLSKWLKTNPKVLILDEPTRGIDIGAKYEIYEIINELVDEGVVIIMISSDLEEVLGMSNRILVISEGELKADLLREEANQEKILHYSTGGT